MKTVKTSLKQQDTYVYIDVSNIRLACLKTLDFRLDFVKLLAYFKQKYPNLKSVRYYEGIAKGDEKKRERFSYLEDLGYEVCPLERKSYTAESTEPVPVKCPACGHSWVHSHSKKHRLMKSNVDVYLTSDMLVTAAKATQPTRLILVSCDGDYAEAIKNIITLNKNISVAVLATPFVKDPRKNTVSARLKALYKDVPLTRYMIHDITDILQYLK